MFMPNSLLLLSTSSDPMRYKALRCQFILHPITSTCNSLLSASSKQIWNMVFGHFYHVWYTSQHPSNPLTARLPLFPCYLHMPSCNNNTLPLYLTALHPSVASTISRLRFNRSRINQSLYMRSCNSTDVCPTCQNNTTETVEHVLMRCPRYDHLRLSLFFDLSFLLKCAPLSSSFPFPFLVCVFPDSIPKVVQVRLIYRMACFLNQVRELETC